MKKLKTAFVVLIIATLFCGLFLRTLDGAQKYERTEFLFDTYCTVTAYSKNADEAVSAAFDEIARIHSLTNFFDETSDVARINCAKKNEKVNVAPTLIAILNIAQEVKLASGGAFDISVAPASMLWKFDEDKPRPPTENDVKAALLSVKNGGIVADTDGMTVTKLSDDTKIDLGGVAKGYAGDAAVRILQDCGVEAAIVDLGGNITCFGKNPNSKDGKWRIGLQVPFKPTGEYGDTVEIFEGAVVTSGTYQRYFEYDGEIYHHIINPQTGYPAVQDFDSVTVVAEDSATADCLATAIYVLGRDNGEVLAKEYGAEIYFN